VRNADKIMVINEGEIVERGTREELLTQKGFYHNLYTSQFRRREGAFSSSIPPASGGRAS
jgi:ABC-type transport system involved in cytochrome bd biosynthesis fused ATPase/permease subunit